MQKSRIKICGITNLADARYAAGAGADYLGFILKTDSPRYIEPTLARDIIQWVHGAEAIGVFADETPETVNSIAETAGFSMVQLHGYETPEQCAACDRPVIKVIHVGASGPSSAANAEELLREAMRYADVASYLLLDTAKGTGSAGGGASEPDGAARDGGAAGAGGTTGAAGVGAGSGGTTGAAGVGAGSGGTGRTFDWSVIGNLPLPFFLAGGLNPSNVATAIAQVHPFAVDVASGVEEAPGRKDFERIDAFIEAVRNA